MYSVAGNTEGMDTQRTGKTAGLSTVLGLILALVLGIAAAAASTDEIGRSWWAGGVGLAVSGVAVVVVGWRFNSQWQRLCAAPLSAQHSSPARGGAGLSTLTGPFPMRLRTIRRRCRTDGTANVRPRSRRATSPTPYHRRATRRPPIPPPRRRRADRWTAIREVASHRRQDTQTGVNEFGYHERKPRAPAESPQTMRRRAFGRFRWQRG